MAVEQDEYAKAGVDITAGNTAVELMRDAVRSTYTPAVLSDLGSFGGLYDAATLCAMSGPVLVASTDGVGTKTKIAALLDRWDTIGQDLVNHCINDILVQGASPLFFMDYVASSRIKAENVATIVQGAAAACRAAGCALIGGETAEMPGVYEPGEIDLAGTIVGVVERNKIIDGGKIAAGDVILGLPANGLHTNGYSLARRVLQSMDLNQPNDELGMTLGEALLAVHTSYLEPVRQLWAAGVETKGLAHITGGGMVENLPRILHNGLGAVINRSAWPETPIFTLIQSAGNIADKDMFRTFNMGLGMLVVVAPDQVELARQTLGAKVYVVGEVIPEQRGVQIRGQRA